ncbi:NlpC/P60 family protein [Streptomyces sp. NPDC013953]|uniref:C40 family peptidase n=1 Tax=Streptomyces sp. NPDC013953 TaxID=3364868 RepID=UPI0036F5B883
MAAKWLSPAAASITTEALRIAGITLLGILAVLFGAVLAQHAMPDEPHAPRPGITLQPPAQTPAEQVPADPPAAKPKPKPKPKPSPKPAPTTVLLRPGDTLWSLAQRHHTTVAALQDANGLGSSTTIYAGKRLYLAPPRPAGPPTAPTEPVRIDPAPGESASPANGAVRAVSFARAQLGKPYIWGGTGPRGYDCSGLVQAAWKAAGVELSRTTYTQVHDGHRTTRSNLAPGDLVITNHGHHVLLYVGGGKVIEAPKPGTVIRTAPLPPDHQVVAYRHITG